MNAFDFGGCRNDDQNEYNTNNNKDDNEDSNNNNDKDDLRDLMLMTVSRLKTSTTATD